ncbi:hypothetical protein Tco_0671955 [Tanacetum coccineum]|uniref:Uncharacterized protein n=1 Tax=Tanacetum coccineum TaxID=301880 RepID=A0ABQ5G1L6_9ASTR
MPFYSTQPLAVVSIVHVYDLSNFMMMIMEEIDLKLEYGSTKHEGKICSLRELEGKSLIDGKQYCWYDKIKGVIRIFQIAINIETFVPVECSHQGRLKTSEIGIKKLIKRPGSIHGKHGSHGIPQILKGLEEFKEKPEFILLTPEDVGWGHLVHTSEDTHCGGIKKWIQQKTEKPSQNDKKLSWNGKDLCLKSRHPMSKMPQSQCQYRRISSQTGPCGTAEYVLDDNS